MSQWNLDQLRNALERRGWTLVAEHPSEDHNISASWEIERSTNNPTIFIDFEGLGFSDYLNTLPMDKSWGCHIRNTSKISLSFRRSGIPGSNRRQIWQDELQTFIEELEAYSVENKE